MNCTACGAPTPAKELATYGARCIDCHKSYCRAPQKPLPSFYTQAGDKPSPREVVQRLLDRQKAGESMSKAQLDFIAKASRKTHPELHGGGE